VFSLRQALPVIGIGLLMTVLAAQAAVGRSARRYPGIYLDSFLAVFGSSFLLTDLALSGIIQVRPWFEPQYVAPILGMALGNTLTGVALLLERFTADVTASRGEIEALLSLGATRWEAAHGTVTTAMRTGIIPVLNTMAAMVIVSLPGTIIGQILAGVSPDTAVRYQNVIIFVMSASSALGSLTVTLLAFRTLFDERDRLRTDRLRARFTSR